jgi:hypothetical protein
MTRNIRSAHLRVLRESGFATVRAAAAVAETTAFYLPPLPGGGPGAPDSGAA